MLVERAGERSKLTKPPGTIKTVADSLGPNPAVVPITNPADSRGVGVFAVDLRIVKPFTVFAAASGPVEN